jgi:uncharacterized cysteine cluster protein YcgN (CxxCxxCC family)
MDGDGDNMALVDWLQFGLIILSAVGWLAVIEAYKTIKDRTQTVTDTYKCQGCGHHATYHQFDSTTRLSRPLGKCAYDQLNDISCRCQNYLGVVPLELMEGR